MRKLLTTFIFIAILVPNVAFGALLDNLVSCWTLDEASGTRVDAVTASGNDLTDNNTVTSEAGTINDAALFTSANIEYLSIDDGSQTGLDITGDMSIAFWTKITTLPVNGISILFFTKYLRAGNQRSYEFILSKDGGVISLSTLISADGASFDTEKVTWAPSTGVKYHLAYTYKASTSKYNFYVDGSLQGTEQTGAKTAIFNSTAITMMGQNDGDLNARSWISHIDELGVWDKVLTASEISDLHNGGSGVSCDGIINPVSVEEVNQSQWLSQPFRTLAQPFINLFNLIV